MRAGLLTRALAALLAALLCAAAVPAAAFDIEIVSITTDGSGDDTAFTDNVNGCVMQVRYVPDGTSPLATGADLDITGESTGLVIANEDDIGTSAFTRAYRQPTYAADGTALLYAASGTNVEDRICVVGERLKVVIAQGGATKSGTFYIVLE